MEPHSPTPDRSPHSTFSRCVELMEAWRIADRAELEFQAAMLSECFRQSSQGAEPRQRD